MTIRDSTRDDAPITLSNNFYVTRLEMEEGNHARDYGLLSREVGEEKWNHGKYESRSVLPEILRNHK